MLDLSNAPLSYEKQIGHIHTLLKEKEGDNLANIISMGQKHAQNELLIMVEGDTKVCKQNRNVVRMKQEAIT